ncbi:MAG: alpha-galactosidase [Eubacterium sp.]|nr:alpha-galactosidase [Eubacterium sp.]
MIRIEGNFFLLSTDHTTYAFHILESGQPEHLYYGKKLYLPPDGEAAEHPDDAGQNSCEIREMRRAMEEKHAHLPGHSVAYSREYPKLALEDMCLEFSSLGKGDIREPFVELCFADGSSTCDFIFESAQILPRKKMSEILPASYDEENRAQSLELHFQEKVHSVVLTLTYSVFEESDTIVRSAALHNRGEEQITIKRLMSGQLDFDESGLVFTDFTGHWAKEMNRNDHVVSAGKHVAASLAGISSNRANPFVMISRQDTTEDHGLCIGCNLIYSGNHYEALEVSGHGKSRFVNGIQPGGFSWQLMPGEIFESPEAVFVLSEQGFGGMSRQMHRFVREHIVRGEWKKKERPILLNSWEASYFKFDRNSLLKLAKKGRDAGIELFVLDDGWFGKRDNDTCSLGDWQVNEKKLPGGLRSLSEEIERMGMLFGIWVEPEMVNEDSDCYRAHPDYAVQIPGRENALGRNQMILDLTREEVQDYVIGQMRDVFSSGKISYVKWDMNRIFSDAYSPLLPPAQAGEFFHRYILGLYRILDRLTTEFPHILFEGCASGGGRFDLGILSYMPQIWASDNTDAAARMEIQEGYSYGYPLSVMGAHVSGCPNHQTLRSTPLETRFHVAAFGLLGYELNLCDISKEDLLVIREQIAFYKEWRSVFQFGEFYRLAKHRWMTVSPDRSRAAALTFQERAQANTFYDKLKTKGLADEKKYHFFNRECKYDIREFGDLVNTVSPVHIRQNSLLHQAVAKFVKMDGEKEDYVLYGSLLNSCGVKLSQAYSATGYDEHTRYYPDYATRMYFMEEENESRQKQLP